MAYISCSSAVANNASKFLNSHNQFNSVAKIFTPSNYRSCFNVRPINFDAAKNSIDVKYFQFRWSSRRGLAGGGCNQSLTTVFNSLSSNNGVPASGKILFLLGSSIVFEGTFATYMCENFKVSIFLFIK